MGRYYPDDQSPDNTGVMDSLTANINNVGNAYVKNKVQDQDRKEKMKQIIQQALLKNMQLKPGADPNRIVQDSGNVDFSQLQNIPQKLGRQGSSMYDVMNAQKILATTPDKWLKQGMATQPSTTEAVPGNPGGWFGIGKTAPSTKNVLGNIQLNPDALAIQARARDAIRAPSSSSGSSPSNVLGQDSQSLSVDNNTYDNTDATDENGDVYADGTISQDESGTQYKVVNSKWTRI